MIAILILNWNGWKDTIECLKSIQKMDYKDYFVVLGDNGSTNESMSEITRFCKDEKITINSEVLCEESLKDVCPGDVILYDLKTNNGFAKGYNLMIKYSKRFNPDYYFLLNNDTEVFPNFMNVLLSFHDKHPEYDVLTPLIPFYYEKDKIWNAGGRLFWGFRKYFYAGAYRTEIKESDYLKCSFVTGCAMLITPKCLKSDGCLFSEAFFFGEDDFELALRFRKEKVKQACVLNSIIYHKVSSSSKAYANYDKIFIHYLNRYINLRQNLSNLSFEIWRIVNNLYLKHILKGKLTNQEILSFVKELNSECYRLDGVSKDYFEKRLKIR